VDGRPLKKDWISRLVVLFSWDNGVVEILGLSLVFVFTLRDLIEGLKQKLIQYQYHSRKITKFRWL
jgi:hypothetical protein